MSKLAFWDIHPTDYPEEYIFCDKTGKYVMATYLLSDSGDTEDDCDYGIFQCGYGDGTLNDDNKPNLFTVAHPKGAFGFSYQDKPKFSSKGNPVKATMKLKNGQLQYGYSKKLRYPDKLKWIIHKELDGSRWLYKPQLLAQDGCMTYYGLGTKAYDVTGWKYRKIMENCNKDGFTYKGINDMEKAISDRETRVIGERTAVTNNWAIQYDGQHVFVVLANYPKMSFGEFKQVIVNEGGSIDEAGFIHRGSAENKVYNPYK